MAVSIWNYVDYKKYLGALIDAEKPSRGKIAKLAEAAGCQPSYLSQVLLKEVQLTPDHALAMAQSLAITNDESEYFCLMVDLARASTPRLREHLKRRMSELKAANVDVGKRLKRTPVVIQENQASYYATWIMSALHILSSIPEYQTVKAAARRLGAPETVIQDALAQLEAIGFVSKVGDRYQHEGGEVHLPKDSPLIALHHQNWRARAVLSSQSRAPEPLHFSGVYAVAKDDLQKLKEIFLQALKESNTIAGDAACEDLVCICCDVFRA